MSLLLQALQKAAKNREQQPPDDPPTRPTRPTVKANPANPAGAALELEPGDYEPMEILSSREPAPADPDPPQPAPIETFDSPTPGQAAVIVGAGPSGNRGRVARLIDWVRDRPVPAFVTAALIFLLAYGVYVALAVFYPELFIPSSSTPPVGPVARSAQKPDATPTPTSAATTPSPAMTDLLAPDQPGAAPAPPAAPTPAPEALAPPAPEPAPAAPPEPPVTTPPAVATPPAAPPTATASASRAPESDRPRKASRAASATASPPADGRVSIRTSDASGGTTALLTEAYDAYQKGQTDKAGGLYERVLNVDKNNVDALLGLGTVSWQQGKPERAIDLYARVLRLDPHNGAAQAGLIGLMGRADPVASESRLKQLIGREPSAPLYFGLGNLYAAQGQWPQAQQAFFQAFQLDPANPDYAFNLAVGLEHLTQQKIAVEYYRKALDLAAARGGAGFDPNQVKARIEQLSATVE
ncbi:MAG: tetratricopeptide repeat protein [Burkholderiales bacterium]|nr:tetratricopeptide repeat protein [Burkholderiales bacterium]